MNERVARAGAWLWLAAGAALLLAGCFGGSVPAVSSGSETESPAETASGPAAETEEASAAEKKVRREGLITGENQDLLTPDQWSAVTAYMDRYYEALSSLEWRDMDDLFADSAGGWKDFNQQTWQYEIQLRAMQKPDLHLDGYLYELRIQEAEQREDGTVAAEIAERSVQNFSQHPWVDSEYPEIRHHFLLENQDGQWLLKEHVQGDGVYWNMYKEFRDQDLEGMENAAEVFGKRKEALLAEAREGMKEREREGESSPDKPAGLQVKSLSGRSVGLADEPSPEPEAMHEYDREAAAAYARRYVGERNPAWPDFSHEGGNCQNFASQCLMAGGIPADLQGEDTWSWTGKSGRAEGPEDTVTWINVDGFDRYAGQNRGYGLQARTDADFYSGDVGDLIKMRTSADWSHVVVITDLIKDEQGETIDYIICSNTTDVRNFPVSAYPMPYQALTRICGWNEEGGLTNENTGTDS